MSIATENSLKKDQFVPPLPLELTWFSKIALDTNVALETFTVQEILNVYELYERGTGHVQGGTDTTNRALAALNRAIKTWKVLETTQILLE